jgi:hypothetical protein
MSYCHLNAGINFSYGFGPQPGDVIRSKVNSCKGGIQMSGDDIVCTSKNYSLSAIPAGASVSWSVYPSGIATVSGNGGSVTVSRSGTARGEVTLRATFTGGCQDPGYFERNIWVGEPEKPTTVDNLGNPVLTLQTCAGNPASVFAEDYVNDHVTNYAWQKGIGVFAMVASGNMATVSHPSAASGAIDVRAQNECGYSLRAFVSVSIQECFDAAGRVKVYPNPANHQMRIVVDEDLLEDRNGHRSGEAILFNLQGQQLRKGTIRNGQADFNTASLPDGIYLLHIQTPEKLIKQQVIIRHK